MTPEQETYFNNMETLFSIPGWTTFIDDLKSNRQALHDSVLSVEDANMFFIAKGRMQVFDQVIGFENLVDTLKAQLAEEDYAPDV